MLTVWIVLRDGKPIYKTKSKPRFDVRFAEERARGGAIDWTTELVQA